MLRVMLGLVLVVGFAGMRSAQDALVNPLQGTWSMRTMTPEDGAAAVDPAHPGIFIFTAEHYSAVYSLGDEPRLYGRRLHSTHPVQ